MNVTKLIVERVRAFEESPFCFSSNLSRYIGATLDCKDVALLYIECVAQNFHHSKGVEIGVAFFIDEIKYSQKHYLWFGLVSSSKKTFESLCCKFDQLANRDVGYIYDYYMNIHRTENVDPQLWSQLDSQLAAPLQPDVTKPPVVYFWSKILKMQ